MQWENLYYALTQLVHNFGALAVAAGAFAGLKLAADRVDLKRTMAWVVLAGWAAQIASGMIFGAISLYLYGETPDLHSVAQAAFVVKILCAATGLMLALLYIVSGNSWQDSGRRRAWHALTGLGATALAAAAFLRWFS